MENRKINACPEFPYFGAKYPDARCIDGALHDMDNCDENGNLYIMYENHPCPFCREEEFIEHWTEYGHSKESVLKWIKQLELVKEEGERKVCPCGKFVERFKPTPCPTNGVIYCESCISGNPSTKG